MRRARNSAASLSIPLLPFALALCATAALALPPKAEAVIRLGSPNTVSLSNGLVGYWPLDGATTNWTSNTTADISGSGNTGTLVSMSITSSPVGGKIGQAFTFNGTSNYASFTTSLANASFSIVGWIFENDLVADRTWFGIGSAGSQNNGLHLRVTTTGLMRLGFFNNDLDTANGVFTAGKWHHVSYTYNVSTGNRDIYLDGAKVAHDSAAAFTGDSVGIIGRLSYSASEFWDVKIDDVRIYNRALSATEVKQLYNLGTAKIGHSNVAISNGLVGYWTFDGKDTNWSTGQTKDLSGNGYHGSLGLMSTTSSPVGGKIGQALSFNGSNNLVQVPYNANLNPPSKMSISAWVYHASASANIETIFEMASPSNELYYALYRGDLGPTYWEIGAEQSDGNYVAEAVPLNLPVGSWHHVVMTADGPNRRVYVDGVLADTQPYDGTIMVDSNAALYFGESPTFGRYWTGKIDDVRIYNRALSASEVNQLYNMSQNTVGHSNVIISNGLVGYWTFDGPSIDWHTNTVRDMSGQGNTGTLISMSTTSSPTIGKIGQAFNYNGTNNYTSFSTSLANASFSVAGWIYANDLTADRTWFGLGSSAGLNTAMHLRIGSTGFLRFGFFSNDLDSTTGIFTAGKWHHVVYTYDLGTGNRNIYMDGANVARDNSAAFTGNSTGAIGRFEAGASEFWYGKIDDVRIYNRALTATEVKQLYNAGR